MRSSQLREEKKFPLRKRQMIENHVCNSWTIKILYFWTTYKRLSFKKRSFLTAKKKSACLVSPDASWWCHEFSIFPRYDFHVRRCAMLTLSIYVKLKFDQTLIFLFEDRKDKIWFGLYRLWWEKRNSDDNIFL